MRQGDLVIIKFPFSNFKNAKIRPALIISGSRYNKSNNVLLIAISTKKGIPGLTEPLLKEDMKEGKVLKSSYIRYTNIASFEAGLVIKKFGSIRKSKVEKILTKLHSLTS
jgi:mRNA interferase MazF